MYHLHCCSLLLYPHPQPHHLEGIMPKKKPERDNMEEPDESTQKASCWGSHIQARSQYWVVKYHV